MPSEPWHFTNSPDLGMAFILLLGDTIFLIFIRICLENSLDLYELRIFHFIYQ